MPVDFTNPTTVYNEAYKIVNDKQTFYGTLLRYINKLFSTFLGLDVSVVNYSGSIPGESSELELVPAVAGKKFITRSLFLLTGVAGVELSIKQKRDLGGGVSATVTLLGPITLAGNEGMVLPWNPDGWCRQAAGSSLVIDTSNEDTVIALSGVYV